MQVNCRYTKVSANIVVTYLHEHFPHYEAVTLILQIYLPVMLVIAIFSCYLQIFDLSANVQMLGNMADISGRPKRPFWWSFGRKYQHKFSRNIFLLFLAFLP